MNEDQLQLLTVQDSKITVLITTEIDFHFAQGPSSSSLLIWWLCSTKTSGTRIPWPYYSTIPRVDVSLWPKIPCLFQTARKNVPASYFIRTFPGICHTILGLTPQLEWNLPGHTQLQRRLGNVICILGGHVSNEKFLLHGRRHWVLINTLQCLQLYRKVPEFIFCSLCFKFSFR